MLLVLLVKDSSAVPALLAPELVRVRERGVFAALLAPEPESDS